MTDTLARYRNTSGKAVYLATDTHWRPEAMELAAVQLAGFLEQEILLSAAAADSEWYRAPEDVKNLGDIAMMLKLPHSQSFFAEEVVTIQPSDERNWRTVASRIQTRRSYCLETASRTYIRSKR